MLLKHFDCYVTLPCSQRCHGTSCGACRYPRDAAFLAEVRKEIAWQARRLGHHACLAIWGGNNEVETAFDWCASCSS